MTNPILDADTRALDDLVAQLRPTGGSAEFTQQQDEDPGTGTIDPQAAIAATGQTSVGSSRSAER